MGGIVLLLKHKELKFEREYAAFSMVNLVILFAAISVPFLTAINMARSYHLALLFLAPFCVIGGITVFRVISRIAKVSWTDKSMRSSLKILSVYFVIFLLYSSGFVFQVTEGQSGSISIGQEEVKQHGNIKIKGAFYNCYVPEQNVFGARWLSENRDTASKVYTDPHYANFLVSYGMMGHSILYNPAIRVQANEYIFLRYFNVKYGVMRSKVKDFYNIAEIAPILDKKNKVYSNGGSYIYR